jgi:hypothetical protein
MRRILLVLLSALEKLGEKGSAPVTEKENNRITETAREARGAEPGPTVRNVLVWSLVLVVVAFAAVYFLFFKT